MVPGRGRPVQEGDHFIHIEERDSEIREALHRRPLRGRSRGLYGVLLIRPFEKTAAIRAGMPIGIIPRRGAEGAGGREAPLQGKGAAA